MIAPAPQNDPPLKGSFGSPIRRAQSMSLTEDEFRGLQKLAGYCSKSAELRKLVGKTALEYLARLGRGEIKLEQRPSGN
jgi:hypothetical protein